MIRATVLDIKHSRRFHGLQGSSRDAFLTETDLMLNDMYDMYDMIMLNGCTICEGSRYCFSE